MASLEWLRGHRELQYLRAAMWECQFVAPPARMRRCRYADMRWRKLQAVDRRFRGSSRRTGGHRPNTRDQDLN